MKLKSLKTPNTVENSKIVKCLDIDRKIIGKLIEEQGKLIQENCNLTSKHRKDIYFEPNDSSISNESSRRLVLNKPTQMIEMSTFKYGQQPTRPILFEQHKDKQAHEEVSIEQINFDEKEIVFSTKKKSNLMNMNFDSTCKYSTKKFDQMEFEITKKDMRLKKIDHFDETKYEPMVVISIKVVSKVIDIEKLMELFRTVKVFSSGNFSFLS